MTNEEMERAIDFLLKSQATLEARIEQVNANLGERIARTNEQLARTDEQLTVTIEQVARVGEQVLRVGEQVEQTNMVVSGLADTQTDFIRVMTRTLEAQAEFNKSTRVAHLELAAAQTRTETTVAKLAEKVDRLADLMGNAGRG